MDFPISVPSIGLVNGKFADEDPLAGTPGSLIPSAWGNAITQEVLNVITGGGLVPAEGDVTQLLKSIKNIIQAGASNIGTDTGAANAYAATYTPAITSVSDQMVVRFKAANANTAASTFTPAPGVIPPAPIVGGAHSALQGGEIVANGDVWLERNISVGGGSWVLLHATGGAVQVPPATKSNHALNKAQADAAYATLASPVFTGAPAAPTLSGTDSTTKLATTAQVQAAIIAAFSAKILSSIGYQKLPGGCIIQWGEVSVTAVNGSYQVFSFPLRFPTNCAVAVGGRKALGSNSVMLVGQASGDPAGQVIFQNFGASTEVGQYIAIGY